jgi:hypothetical protein
MRGLFAFFVGIALAGSTPTAAQQIDVGSGSIAETVSSLRPGQYVWAPGVAPAGPILLIVNVKTQRAVLFRNGVPIAATTISTGREGRETPTGVFTVLQKQIEHYSSKYDNAPMPYMQRLTWQGVALHAGHLPGYPASHGCIRLPAGFAKLLYGVTTLGMTVVITDRATTPRLAPTPEFLETQIASTANSAAFEWHPERAPAGPVSIVVSATDQKAVVLRNGTIIGTGTVTVEGPVTSTWVYELRNIDGQGQHWIRLQLSGKTTGDEPVPKQEWQRFHAAGEFRRGIAAIVRPGTTVIVTADSLLSGASPTVPILDSSGS